MSILIYFKNSIIISTFKITLIIKLWMIAGHSREKDVKKARSWSYVEGSRASLRSSVGAFRDSGGTSLFLPGSSKFRNAMA